MRKGISPLIAAVLLIAFTMSVAALFAQWAPSLMQSTQSGVDDRQDRVIDSASSQMKIEKAEFNSSSGNYTVTVRNSGSTNITDYVFTIEGDNPTQKQISGTLTPNDIKTVEVPTGDTSKSDIEVTAENVASSTSTSSEQVEEESSSGGNGDDGGSNSAPTASFTDNVTDPSIGDTIEFDGTGSSDSDGSISSYEWDWTNDGNYEDTGSTATHSYSSSGDKTVKLKVTDDGGKTDTTTNTVNVQSGGTLTQVSYSTQSDWNQGTFNGTSADRSDNPGTLGMGYLNGTNPAATVPTTDLAGYWRFDGTSGSATDYSGNSNDGSPTNFDGTERGKEGTFNTSSFRFYGDDGQNRYVDLGNPTSLEIKQNLTFGGWVNRKKNDRGAVMAIGEAVGGAGGSGYYLISGKDGHMEANIVTGSVGNDNDNVDGKAPTEEWAFVMGRYNGTHLGIFVNGTLQNSTATSGDIAYTKNYNWRFGRKAWQSSLFYNGTADDLQIYDHSLSQSEINALYHYGKDDVYEADYTGKKIDTSSSQSWSKLEVDVKSMPSNTDVDANFTALDTNGNLVDSEVINLNTGLNNYSISVSNSEDAQVIFNGTTSQPTKSWEIGNYSVYYN